VSSFSLKNLNLLDFSHMHEIEEQVQAALINALNAQPQEEVSETDDEFTRLQPVRKMHPDGQSISSGAGLSLAMDVQQTESEESEDPNRYFAPTTLPQPSNSLDQFYVELDSIEDYMDSPEKLPYDGLNEKLKLLKVRS
jgi:hypothetical protein